MAPTLSGRTAADGRLRAAIVGTGSVAEEHVASLHAWADRVELVAVADVDPARAAGFAVRHDVAAAFGDVRQLLSGTAPGLVIVCTPPGSHAVIARTAAAAGAAVLLEKPAVRSLAELDELAAAVSTPVASVAQHRFGEGAVHLRRLARTGALGRAMSATCETEWFRDDAYFAVPWHGDWDLAGGGPTLTLGLHQIDLLLSVLGPWSEVVGLTARRARRTATEDVSAAAVRFASGALATVSTSALSPRQSSRIRFDFERATVEVEHLYGHAAEDWRFTPADGADLSGRWAPAGKGQRSSHTDQLGSVLDALEAGTPPPVDLADTRRSLELIAALYRSARTGHAVTAGEIGPGDPFHRSMRGDASPFEDLA